MAFSELLVNVVSLGEAVAKSVQCVMEQLARQSAKQAVKTTGQNVDSDFTDGRYFKGKCVTTHTFPNFSFS